LIRKRLWNRARSKEWWFFVLISPWFIGFLMFKSGPILGAILLTFTRWSFPSPPVFVGGAHLREMASDPLLRQTFFNSLFYAVGTAPTGVILGLGLALLVNRKKPGVVAFRTLFFLPVVTSGVAMTLIWGWVFNPEYGLINGTLATLGIDGPGWLNDTRWAMPAMILIGLWNLGVNMVVYLSALQNVPGDLYESAALDGASNGAIFRHITWPLITPTTFYLIVVNLIGAFQVFTPIYILTQGGPDNATLTLPLYIYLNAFAWGRIGYASALSLFLLGVILALTLVQFRWADRWVFYLGGQTR
jgi:multiple sugar transport system permease protein